MLRAREKGKEKQTPSLRNESRNNAPSDNNKRSEEATSYSTPKTPAALHRAESMNRKTSFSSEDRDYQTYQTTPQRVLRTKGSFASDDRGYPSTPYQQAPPSSRPLPRSSFDDRDRPYDQGSYSRPYPTPPSSASRPATTREYNFTPDPYETRPEGPHQTQEQRSATWRAAHMPESPPKRRSSEGRPSINREPSFSKHVSRKIDDVESPDGMFTFPDFIQTMLIFFI